MLLQALSHQQERRNGRLARRILITGGAGFIGSHLADRALARGDAVTVLDDLSGGRPENIHPDVRFVRGDILDARRLSDLVGGADAVFHLAAKVSVQDCIKHWQDGHRINLQGTMAVLHAAQQAGGVPVVYASSAAVYGDQGNRACRESDLPLPISPYAADKLASEHQARAMGAIHGLASVGLRFFNVYGPRQDVASPYAGVIARLCANRLADRVHVLFGDGLQSRDFIHVRDVVESILKALDLATRRGGASVFNVCTGSGTTLLDLASCIDCLAGRGRTPVSHAAARAGDIRHSRGDPEAARLGLDFTASTDLDTGVADLLAAMSDAPVPAR